jgi:hypothetical protein
MSEVRHFPAAFINNIADEGTKAEAVEWLQKTWNQLQTLREDMAARDIEISNAAADLQVVRHQIQQLILAGTDTSRKSPQTMRDDLQHGPGAWLSPVEIELRKALGYCYSAGHIYGDDGEFHDARMPFPIDYMRDSVDTIRKQIQARGQYQINTFKQMKNLLQSIVQLENKDYGQECAAGAQALAQDMLDKWFKPAGLCDHPRCFGFGGHRGPHTTIDGCVIESQLI